MSDFPSAFQFRYKRYEPNKGERKKLQIKIAIGLHNDTLPEEEEVDVLWESNVTVDIDFSLKSIGATFGNDGGKVSCSFTWFGRLGIVGEGRGNNPLICEAGFRTSDPSFQTRSVGKIVPIVASCFKTPPVKGPACLSFLDIYQF